MIYKESILSLSLVREVKQPVCEEEKFRNSDKSWLEVGLGKNAKALDAAFVGVLIASKDLSTSDLTIHI